MTPGWKTAWVVSCLFAAGAAQAQFSSTWTLASDYDFRGTSNSAGDPVLQASVDYEARNGFWAGVWASNFDYGRDELGREYDGAVELDLYAGYTRELSDTRAWSFGLTAYTFPDSDGSAANGRIGLATSYEGYVDVTLGGFHAAQWYTPDYAKLGASAAYTEANYTWTLPRAWRLRAHAGYSWGEYWDDATLGGGGQADYSLGLARDVRRFTLAARLTGTDASGARRISAGPFRNDARFVVAVETTFPWRD